MGVALVRGVAACEKWDKIHYMHEMFEIIIIIKLLVCMSNTTAIHAHMYIEIYYKTITAN